MSTHSLEANSTRDLCTKNMLWLIMELEKEAKMHKLTCDTTELHAAILIITLIFIATLLVGGTAGYMLVIPRCSEDVVLVGEGEFDAGRWSDYSCGPAVDDLVKEN